MITADFDFTTSSIDEFLRILAPEALSMNIDVTSNISSASITLKFTLDSLTYEFTFKNIQNKLEDQLFIMIKSGILKLLNKSYPWGSLTGVRPTKIVRKLLNIGFSYQDISAILLNLYLVSMPKIDLVINVVKTELNFLNNNFINVYAGIPYCPTKCKYCSFASYEKKGKVGKEYDNFLSALLNETKISGNFLKKENIPIESFYIGGGTPTVLNESELETFLKSITENFDLSNLKEFTLEAGRVDSITKEKLEIAKKFGVSRISINPQSFNKATLEALNRPFDLDLFNEIYNYAISLGFIINMDLIIGLPGESVSDILFTLDKVSSYNIQNLTIHMLAIKRASGIYQANKDELMNKSSFNKNYVSNFEEYSEIENKIFEIVKQKGMIPYYLYRQKNSFDFGENIGYAIPGTESHFNIEMIEEFQSTFGIGGGAITKIISSDSIDRYVNPKDPIVYINEINERLNEKMEAFKSVKTIMLK